MTMKHTTKSRYGSFDRGEKAFQEMQDRVAQNKIVNCKRAFVEGHGVIPSIRDHVERFSPLSNRTKEILLERVNDYLRGFDLVLLEIEAGRVRDDFKQFFQKEIDLANELKADLTI
jgi:hypothetical protein